MKVRSCSFSLMTLTQSQLFCLCCVSFLLTIQSGRLVASQISDEDDTTRTFLCKEAPLWAEWDSGWDAVDQLEKVTGLKVLMPECLGEFYCTQICGFGIRTSFREDSASIEDFINSVCRGIGANWTLDLQKRQLNLDFAWRTQDQRSGADLLKILKRPDKLNEEWVHAFHAILSSSVNFDSVWRIRQKSLFHGIFRGGLFGADSAIRRVDVILVGDIVTTEQQQFTLVLIRHNDSMSPGWSGVSCYEFDDAGTVQGASYLCTGYRCTVEDARLLTPDQDVATTLEIGVLNNCDREYRQWYQFSRKGMYLTKAWGLAASWLSPADLEMGRSLMEDIFQ